ncbi:MAG: glutamine synthetase family protein [Bacteroidetes bacterium]|nr:glutamine synthetase family protein [Bacteroidota bacterium]
MNQFTEMNPNPLVQYLNKPSSEFTKADIIRYAEDHDIAMINFRYCGWDGRLKTLNFVINSKQHLDSILSYGERVDGSSLFSFIEAGSSDLYVIPRYKTAFRNPFSEVPTLDILCSYYNKDGEPLASSPEYILKKAHQTLTERTGYTLDAMGELEYYIISQKGELFQATDQRGYHEAEPFSKWGNFRREAMVAIAEAGGLIKYGHSEVGNFIVGDLEYEQNEIEFAPTNIEDAADQLLIAKWILRTLAHKHGVTVTFAPKITTGKAGSGMHVHSRLMKNGVNLMTKKNGELSDLAKKVIAGYLDLAPSLTAFGNLNPMSYFRLVPHQEAPTNICWGDRNRSVLVRVPLGWTGKLNMADDANPQQTGISTQDLNRQTVELRSPDGSADIYMLMAGIAVAARHGLEMKNALNYAQRTYVDVNIFNDENKKRLSELNHLPASCWESGNALEKQKEHYLKYGIFTEGTLKGIVQYHKQFNDQNLREELKDKPDELLKLVQKFFHCG